MFFGWGGRSQTPCVHPKQKTNSSNQSVRFGRRKRRGRNRRDRLGAERWPRWGPGAAVAAKRPETGASTLSARWEYDERLPRSGNRRIVRGGRRGQLPRSGIAGAAGLEGGAEFSYCERSAKFRRSISQVRSTGECAGRGRSGRHHEAARPELIARAAAQYWRGPAPAVPIRGASTTDRFIPLGVANFTSAKTTTDEVADVDWLE